jgi:hypothetical protein
MSFHYLLAFFIDCHLHSLLKSIFVDRSLQKDEAKSINIDLFGMTSYSSSSSSAQFFLSCIVIVWLVKKKFGNSFTLSVQDTTSLLLCSIFSIFRVHFDLVILAAMVQNSYKAEAFLFDQFECWRSPI